MMQTKYFKDFFLVFILCLSVFVLILTTLFLPRKMSFIELSELKENFISEKGSDWIKGISIILQPITIILFAFIIISIGGVWILTVKNKHIKAKNFFYKILEISSVFILVAILIWYLNEIKSLSWYLHCSLASIGLILISLFAIRMINRTELTKRPYKRNRTSKIAAA